MVHQRRAKLFQNGGSQAVRLPAEYRFEGDEVFIRRDEVSGDVILSSRPRRKVWQEYIAWRDALGLSSGELDEFMAERPMNHPVDSRSVFEDET